ncbi:hypothetical protein ACFDR9_004850 [Janthinobacterium sp. CG_23.3]|uniref:hypothetical protein n=1 Tax=Janthinobacterium sp. CG_23.3 TaxID=3349634 RepID=UPI0038D419CF
MAHAGEGAQRQADLFSHPRRVGRVGQHALHAALDRQQLAQLFFLGLQLELDQFRPRRALDLLQRLPHALLQFAAVGRRDQVLQRPVGHQLRDPGGARERAQQQGRRAAATTHQLADAGQVGRAVELADVDHQQVDAAPYQLGRALAGAVAQAQAFEQLAALALELGATRAVGVHIHRHVFRLPLRHDASLSMFYCHARSVP